MAGDINKVVGQIVSKWLEVETDTEDADVDETWAKHSVAEVDSENGNRKLSKVVCPLCQGEITRTRFLGILKQQPSGDQPAQAKFLVFDCQNAHNFVIFPSGDAGFATEGLLLFDQGKTIVSVIETETPNVQKSRLN